jgi:polyhydroxyalkanoate synthesis regulator phasin
MNKIIKQLAIALFLVSTLQFTTFATEITVPKVEDEIHNRISRWTNHYSHTASKILENKYGMCSADIEKAKKEGKTFFDLAKTKGVSEADFKAAIISPKLKGIDAAVATGELTKEKASDLKTKLKESISKWDGKIEDSKHRDMPKEDKEEKKENTDNPQNNNPENQNEQAS